MQQKLKTIISNLWKKEARFKKNKAKWKDSHGTGQKLRMKEMPNDLFAISEDHSSFITVK